MGKLSLSERLSAHRFALDSHLRSSDEQRIMRMPFGVVPRATTEDIPRWTTFNEFRPEVYRGVGVIALRRSAIAEVLGEHPDARLGVVLPVGRAVVFGETLPYMRTDVIEHPNAPEDVTFSVRIPSGVTLKIAPALQFRDKSVQILDAAITDKREMPLDSLSPHVPVY